MESMEEKFDGLKPLQEKECELLCYLNDFCEANGIVWCLAFGSALGARRHGGPIPWDDDADVYMSAADYEKFRRAFREKGDRQRFYLQEMDCVDGKVCTGKLRMNGTTFIDEPFRNFDMHQGIYIDIFILYEASDSSFERMKQKLLTGYFIVKRLSNHNYLKRKSVQPLLKFLRLFPKRFGLKTVYRNFNKWENRPGKYLFDPENTHSNPRWYLLREDIFPVRRMEYAGHRFCVPNHIEKYLEATYGDWKKIPNMDQINWAHHAGGWSIDRDFRETAPNIHDFKDERIERLGRK